MAVTYRDGISILKLVVYAPYLLATIYVCCRHGFTKSSGWIFLTIFCVVRIISASSQLATINNTNPKTAYTVAAVTDSIGLSPLLLASLGLISRAYVYLDLIQWVKNGLRSKADLSEDIFLCLNLPGACCFPSLCSEYLRS